MSEITNNIKHLTKSYYNTQLYINQLNAKLQELREQKKTVELSLINEIHKNGLHNQAITYQNKKIYVKNENTYEILSYKFLEDCLLKIHKGNKEQVKNIIKFIKSQRHKTSKYCINIS